MDVIVQLLTFVDAGDSHVMLLATIWSVPPPGSGAGGVVPPEVGVLNACVTDHGLR